jgi:hypothetical protein
MEQDWLYQHMHVKLFSIREPNYFVYERIFFYLEKIKKIIEHLDCTDEHPMPKCSINLHNSGQAVDNGVACTNTNSVVNSLTSFVKLFHLEMLTQSGSFLVHVSCRNLQKNSELFDHIAAYVCQQLCLLTLHLCTCCLALRYALRFILRTQPFVRDAPGVAEHPRRTGSTRTLASTLTILMSYIFNTLVRPHV